MAAERASGQQSEGHGMRILVIDDSKPLREALQEMLEDVGYVVAAAADGQAGLNAFSQGPFDVVVTDLLMPGKEGIETIKELRQRDAGIGIVAISGGDAMTGLRLLAFARELGADSALAKPFGQQELMAAIDEALAMRSGRTAKPRDRESPGAN